ncbi:endonuclease/exonuclease/phosphatase family protein [Thermodesulforhabdus norvegica]|uniref:Metal-dependent hydrolase, endonuclease/exonuclease/phosphatase family n=1 Tax=Thermodesulforhabdus norvegica TaxID=39841 RepID=A0A1I4S5J4_9BACT|nr:endonuclease/exonuclease/phosphatase family protein [Thermodesulforhabdus norvegica]SFM59772.1 Metal-dependent hydrolase, endonuclease/exonuclease/phosphatase family [Thermodesulforhabdus norvegica]
MQVIRAMTFNIRFDNPEDGERRWGYRREMVASVIERYHPDIVGLQEATWRQIFDLRELLPGYGFCLKNRVWDDTCQYPTLVYRRDTVECLGNSEFWLSTTPGVHRSKDWGSAFPRMFSYGQFRIKEIPQVVTAGVSHLDNRSDRARSRQAMMIADWYKSQDTPCIIMGDFNEQPDGNVHSILCSSSLEDTWKSLGFPEDELAMTHHDFEGNPDKGRLDWILVSPHFMVLNGEIVRDSADGKYPSDHFPYYVDLAPKDLS